MGNGACDIDIGVVAETFAGVRDLYCLMADECLRVSDLTLVEYTLLRSCREESGGLTLKGACIAVPLSRDRLASLFAGLEERFLLYQVRGAEDRRIRAYCPTMPATRLLSLVDMALGLRLAAGFGGTVDVAGELELLAAVAVDVARPPVSPGEPDALWDIVRCTVRLYLTYGQVAHEAGLSGAVGVLDLLAAACWPTPLDLSSVRGYGMRRSSLLSLVPLCELMGLVEVDGRADDGFDDVPEDDMSVTATEQGRLAAQGLAATLAASVGSGSSDEDLEERLSRLVAVLALR